MSAQDETGPYSPKPKLIEQTKTVVENNIANISSVTELANMMGYSRSYFSSRVKEVFDKPPSEIIRDKRFQRIKKEIRNHPFESSDAIARRVGFTGNKRLYKFLADHFNTTFTKLRKKLVFGNPPPSD